MISNYSDPYVLLLAETAIELNELRAFAEVMGIHIGTFLFAGKAMSQVIFNGIPSRSVTFSTPRSTSGSGGV